MTARSSVRLAAAAAALALGGPALAQGGGGGGGGQPPRNLQFFAKGTPRDSLTPIMRGFTAALGVQCSFCHTERQGAAPGGGGGGGGGGPPLDHSLDDKDTKKTARVMLRMMDSINTHFLKMIPNRTEPAAMVTCATCHRGLSKPTTMEAVLAAATAKSGVDSAIATYRLLRNDMASGKYNFTEGPVTTAAMRLSAAGKYDDAMKLLQMNAEFYPASTTIEFQMAEVLVAKGDKDGAIAKLKAVLAKNPNDRRAQQRLTQLGAQP